jgi:uncharacterized lipoprotein
MNRRILLAALMVAAVSGCSSSSSTKQPLSEHQRDSVISRSSLPGAATVGKALEHQDDALQRTASLDSLTQ